jgi:adenylylsulfate kinase
MIMLTNLYHHRPAVTKSQREQLNGHKSLCLWFTGLSGSGKSSIANKVIERLHEQSIHTYLLDGDNTRMGLSKGLGFSEPERKENIRRVGEVCNLMNEAGLVVLAAFISPFKDDRNMVRQLLPKDTFVEIYVQCPLQQCEQRDPKGLYKKARAGEISNFTGIDSPYEQPESPELIVYSGMNDIETCARQVLTYVEPRLKL